MEASNWMQQPELQKFRLDLGSGARRTIARPARGGCTREEHVLLLQLDAATRHLSDLNTKVTDLTSEIELPLGSQADVDWNDGAPRRWLCRPRRPLLNEAVACVPSG